MMHVMKLLLISKSHQKCNRMVGVLSALQEGPRNHALGQNEGNFHLKIRL